MNKHAFTQKKDKQALTKISLFTGVRGPALSPARLYLMHACARRRFGADLFLPAWINPELRRVLASGKSLPSKAWKPDDRDFQRIAMSIIMETEDAYVPEVPRERVCVGDGGGSSAGWRGCSAAGSSFVIFPMIFRRAKTLSSSFICHFCWPHSRTCACPPTSPPYCFHAPWRANPKIEPPPPLRLHLFCCVVLVRSTRTDGRTSVSSNQRLRKTKCSCLRRWRTRGTLRRSGSSTRRSG